MLLNSRKLEENILGMKEITAESEAHKEIKKLFLILAGDKRVIRECTLEDFAYYFNHAAEILEKHEMMTSWEKYAKYLQDYKKKRRAV